MATEQSGEAAADRRADARRDDDPVVGEVCITIPAHPQFLRLLRLVASGFASDLGFDSDELEEIRIAVDEAGALLLQDPAVRSIDLVIAATGPDELRASVVAVGTPGWAVEVDPIAAELLAIIVERLEITSDPHGRHEVSFGRRTLARP